MALKQKVKTQTQAALVVLLLTTILIALNFLGFRHFIRLDLTEDQEYTLSDATKTMLKKLDDRVTVKLFLSENVSPNLTSIQQGILDLLHEYERYAGSKITIQRITPDTEEKEQEAQLLGIPPLQLNVVSKDRQEVAKVYFGLALLYGDKKEIIPVVTDLSQLEYEMSSSLFRLTSPRAPRLGLIVPQQTDPIGNSSYTFFQEILQKQYEIQIMSPSEDLISQHLDLLVILEPKEIPQKSTQQIDTLISQGIPVVIFAGNVKVGADLTVSSYVTGLESWLKDHYGIEITSQLLIDPNDPAYATFSNGMVQHILPYPFFVKVPERGLNHEHPITARLENIVFPWTNALILDPQNPSGFSFTPLAHSSSISFTQGDIQRATPEILEGLNPNEMKEYPLAIVAQKKLDQVQKTARLIVVSNHYLIQDSLINNFQANALFTLNIIDWTVLGEDLITIRSRGKTERPLMMPASETIVFIKGVYLMGLPLLIIATGLGLGYSRKKKRQKLVTTFNH